MPNWCSNSIEFNGTHSEMLELIKIIKSDKEEFDFNQVLPLKEGDNASNKWGTKWSLGKEEAIKNEINKFLSDEKSETLQFSFDTAWAPPIGVYEALNEKINKHCENVNFTGMYIEPGMMIYGTFSNETGDFIDNDESDLYEDIHFEVKFSKINENDKAEAKKVVDELFEESDNESVILKDDKDDFILKIINRDNLYDIESFDKVLSEKLSNANIESTGVLYLEGNDEIILNAFSEVSSIDFSSKHSMRKGMR